MTNLHIEERSLTSPKEEVEVESSRAWMWRVSLWAMIGLPSAVAIFWSDLPSQVVGVLCLIVMFGLLGMKVPVGAAMAIPGILGIWVVAGVRGAEGTLSRMPFESTASWSLTVIPMFILMGVALTKSGLTENLYTVARHWTGWLPGGLAIGTTVAGAGFAALSGSTFGSVFPLTRAGVPEMLKAGYDKRLAIASVMGAGTLAHLIPPSLLLVIYAGTAGTPVGPQLMAGLLPGILLILLYCLAIVGVSILWPALAGRSQTDGGATWSQRWRALGTIWPAPLLVLVVVVGMYQGFLTATEAGAAGAFGAVLITLLLRRKNRPFRALGDALVSTVSTVGAMFFLIIGAYIFTRMLTISGLANSFISFVADLGLSRIAFLLLLIVVYLILGMFMDSLAIMLITVPLLLPLFEPMGISPIWFGVFIVVFLELAVITPPVGVLSFIMHGLMQAPEVNVGHKITLSTVFKAALFVIPVAILLVLLMIIEPDFVLWIPNSMTGS